MVISYQSNGHEVKLLAKAMRNEYVSKIPFNFLVYGAPIPRPQLTALHESKGCIIWIQQWCMECLPVWSVWSSIAQEDTCKLWKKSLHTPLQLVIPANRLASQVSHPLDLKILSLDHTQIAARDTNMLLSITHPALNASRLNTFNCMLFSIHEMEM